MEPLVPAVAAFSTGLANLPLAATTKAVSKVASLLWLLEPFPKFLHRITWKFCLSDIGGYFPFLKLSGFTLKQRLLYTPGSSQLNPMRYVIQGREFNSSCSGS